MRCVADGASVGDCLRRGVLTHPTQVVRYAELRYRQSKIRALEPFDCALTYEPFGGNPREENLTRVISRRFYELLIRNFIRVKAVPVRLDPD